MCTSCTAPLYGTLKGLKGSQICFEPCHLNVGICMCWHRRTSFGVDVGVVLMLLLLSEQVMLEDLEKKVEVLTSNMYDEGKDAKTVENILKDKDGTEARISSLYKEVRSYPNTYKYKGTVGSYSPWMS